MGFMLIDHANVYRILFSSAFIRNLALCKLYLL